jgi:hypothetical protein
MAIMRLLIAILAIGVAASPTCAHELTDNRATLVLRDRTHLSLTLFVRYTEAIHRALAPAANYGEFLLAMSALSPADFQKQLRLAHDTIQSGMQVTLGGRRERAITNFSWIWPDPVRAQQLFQQQVMEATVGTTGHRHEEPVEVRADVTSAKEITSASVRFSDALGKVLIVWYRPRQAWVEAGQPSPLMKFD